MDGTSTFRGGKTASNASEAKKSQFVQEVMDQCKTFIMQEVTKSLSQYQQSSSCGDENTHPNILAGRVIESGRVPAGSRLLDNVNHSRQFERTLEMKIDSFLDEPRQDEGDYCESVEEEEQSYEQLLQQEI